MISWWPLGCYLLRGLFRTTGCFTSGSGLLKLLEMCSLVDKSHVFILSCVCYLCTSSFYWGKSLRGLAFLFGSGAGWWLGFVCVYWGFSPKSEVISSKFPLFLSGCSHGRLRHQRRCSAGVRDTSDPSDRHGSSDGSAPGQGTGRDWHSCAQLLQPSSSEPHEVCWAREKAEDALARQKGRGNVGFSYLHKLVWEYLVLSLRMLINVISSTTAFIPVSEF